MTTARDNCFDPAEDLLPLHEALDRLRAQVQPISRTETVALSGAAGRVLAADMIAATNVPPHDNSAVDGYAVHHADLAADAEIRLPVTARIAAGHPHDGRIGRGAAARIFTGAPMPEGPDTVIMQEDTTAEGDHVVIRPGVKHGANRRRAGEDVRTGMTVLPQGRLLRPQDVGLAAAIGAAEVTVYAPLRAAVFSTGDEVRDPGCDLPPGGIFDANRFTIAAALRAMGCVVTDLGILPDRLAAIRDALAGAAADHDLLITSGGVSLGDEDHVKAAVEAQGSMHFWRLAIKPGRPIALGQVGLTPFIGLPGNPVAALVTFMRIGRTVVERLAGRTETDTLFFKVPAGFAMNKKPGRREWLRVRLDMTAQGPVARKFAAQGSGILSSMVDADGLVELPEDLARIEEGDMLDFLSFNEVMR